MRKITFWWALGLLGLGWAVACGRAASSTGSNTNWLRRCDVDADCPANAECWCHACAASCTSDVACGEGACRAPSELGCAAPSASGTNLCVAVCTRDADCTRENTAFACVNGACLPGASTGSEGGAPGDAGGAPHGDSGSGGTGNGGRANGGSGGASASAGMSGGTGAPSGSGGGGAGRARGGASGVGAGGARAGGGGHPDAGAAGSSVAGGTGGAPLGPRRLTGLDNRIVEFVFGIQESQPNVIAVGPDGNLWFGEPTLGGGSMTLGGVGGPYGVSATTGLVVGFGGTVWASDSGSISQYDFTAQGPGPASTSTFTDSAQITSLTLGPDSLLWFTDSGRSVVGSYDSVHSVWSEYPLTLDSRPTSITSGPDGALWITEDQANDVLRMTIDGVVGGHWPLPTAGASPQAITAGPDGALWFTERDANKIGRLTTAGELTEFDVPTFNSQPFGITAGPDGAVWFTEKLAAAIGRITPDGAVTEYVLDNATPLNIVTGPDGDLWFTDAGQPNEGFGKIGRLTPETKPFARMTGGLVVGSSCTAPMWMAVTNTGDAPVTELGTDLDEDNPDRANVVLTDHCSGVSLDPGESCLIDFAFAPGAPQRFNLTITITPAQGEPFSFVAIIDC